MAEAEDDATASGPRGATTSSTSQLEHQDAYSIDHRVEEVLTGLGFAESEFHRAAHDVLRRPAIADDAGQAAAAKAPT